MFNQDMIVRDDGLVVILGSKMQSSQFCEQIGRVRLDQYCWDETLRQDTQERENILMDGVIFSQESMAHSNIDAILNYSYTDDIFP
jgi:hypothetical protein